MQVATTKRASPGTPFGKVIKNSPLYKLGFLLTCVKGRIPKHSLKLQTPFLLQCNLTNPSYFNENVSIYIRLSFGE